MVELRRIGITNEWKQAASARNPTKRKEELRRQAFSLCGQIEQNCTAVSFFEQTIPTDRLDIRSVNRVLREEEIDFRVFYDGRKLVAGAIVEEAIDKKKEVYLFSSREACARISSNWEAASTRVNNCQITAVRSATINLALHQIKKSAQLPQDTAFAKIAAAAASRSKLQAIDGLFAGAKQLSAYYLLRETHHMVSGRWDICRSNLPANIRNSVIILCKLISDLAALEDLARTNLNHDFLLLMLAHYLNYCAREYTRNNYPASVRFAFLSAALFGYFDNRDYSAAFCNHLSAAKRELKSALEQALKTNSPANSKAILKIAYPVSFAVHKISSDTLQNQCLINPAHFPRLLAETSLPEITPAMVAAAQAEVAARKRTSFFALIPSAYQANVEKLARKLGEKNADGKYMTQEEVFFQWLVMDNIFHQIVKMNGYRVLPPEEAFAANSNAEGAALTASGSIIVFSRPDKDRKRRQMAYYPIKMKEFFGGNNPFTAFFAEDLQIKKTAAYIPESGSLQRKKTSPLIAVAIKASRRQIRV